MTIASKLLGQFRKPAGWFGRLNLLHMNRRHSQSTDWGLGHVSIAKEAIILDIGCGAGILSEPLARMHADVMGADPAAANIAAAKLHAGQAGLRIDYRASTAAALADAGERFDVILAMEVVEHVADLNLFVRQCAQMIRPGGLIMAATINRTLKSFALAIVGAEYILRWLPRGTHRWEKFVTPDELSDAFEACGLTVLDETGIIYDLLADRWRLASDMDVNYMMAAQKPMNV